MRVKTPAIKLDVTLESISTEDDALCFSGLAGLMPCETRISIGELLPLIGMLLKPRIIWWVIKALLTPGKSKTTAKTNASGKSS